MESQKKRLYEWAITNGYTVDEEISDIKSGMSFAERQGFVRLIKMATQHEIGTLIIENRDRLTRFGFEMMEHTLKCLGVNVIVVSNVDNKSYEKELIDDLISIIHYYSMKSYGLRKKLHNAELSIKKEVETEEK